MNNMEVYMGRVVAISGGELESTEKLNIYA